MSAPAEQDSIHGDSNAKRRKIRKGTTSCWECKRRKLRCIFNSSEAICTRCQRRGSKCVRQEFPEEISAPLNKSRQLDDRMVRVEALVEQLVKKLDGEGTVATRQRIDVDNGNYSHGLPTPSSISSGSSQLLVSNTSLEVHHLDGSKVENETLAGPTSFARVELSTDTPLGSGRYEELSRGLHRSLPSSQDIDTICKACLPGSVSYHDILTIPYSDFDGHILRPIEHFKEIPEPTTHPVLIARYMLSLATFFQYSSFSLPNELEGLSEPLPMITKRLADTAISFVTTNDELLDNIEGLECVMIESLYQVNGGNLRRSWVAIRKAMVIAHLMGLHRPDTQFKLLDSKTKSDPRHMWYRIIFYDRYLCLMLGLPQGSLDRSMATDAMLANDTPLGRLERMHCVIASRVLERNDSGIYDPSSSEELDTEMQRAAKNMPTKWWLIPSIAQIVGDDPKAAFWGLRQLGSQMFHYTLLNQIHLPFMLRSSVERRYEYSKITCVSASRDVLLRFVSFCGLPQPVSCYRTITFFALTASLTLLLAHLDSYRSTQTRNILANQRLGDRAMIEQAQEQMEQSSRVNKDELSTQSADLLRRLLDIEAEAANGHTQSAESVTIQAPGTEMALPDEDDRVVVRMTIPYFGIIRIARDGMISKEMPKSNPPMAANGQNLGQSVGKSMAGDSNFRGKAGTHSYGDVGLRVSHNIGGMELTENHCNYANEFSADHDDNNNITTTLATQFSNITPSDVLQQYQYPGLTAGIDDWAFQGVDFAFFDSLLKGTEYNEGGAQWTT